MDGFFCMHACINFWMQNCRVGKEISLCKMPRGMLWYLFIGKDGAIYVNFGGSPLNMEV